MNTWSFNLPPPIINSYQLAVLNSGQFTGRAVEILPDNYLDEAYCRVRDCQFGIELTVKKENVSRREG